MKKIFKSYIFCAIICLVLLLCFYPQKSTPLKVDYHAIKYTNEFTKDLLENNIPIRTIKDSIDDIVFYPLESDTYGIYSPPNRQLVLNSFYYRDTILIRKVIYHELGHIYGLRHDTQGIMDTGQQVIELHRLYDPLYGGSNKQWDIHKAYLFHRIRKHLKNLDKSK